MADNKKVCKSCRKSIDAQAKKCPYCQSDQRNWFRRHPILTFIGILFLLPFLTGFLITSNNEPSTSVSNQRTVSPTQVPRVTLIDKIEDAQSEPGQVFTVNGAEIFVGEPTDSIIRKIGKPNNSTSDNSEYKAYGIVSEYEYDEYSLLMALEPKDQKYYVVWDIYLNE